MGGIHRFYNTKGKEIMEEKTKDLLTRMEKGFKIILWIIGGIVVLGILAAIFLLFTSTTSIGVSPG